MSSPFLDSLGLGTPRSAKEPAWLASLRDEAVGRLKDEGLPTAKTEAWRFTSVDKLLRQSFVPAKATLADTAKCIAFAEVELGASFGLRLLLVNGRPLEVPALPEGVTVQPLAQALANNAGSVQPFLARQAHSEHFGALNSALFEDGLVIHIAKNTKLSAPVEIVHLSDTGSSPTSSHPRLLIVAEALSECELVETYLGLPSADHFVNAVTEVYAQDGAQVEHTRLVLGSDETNHLGTLAVHQDRDSNYTSRSVVMGGKLVRLEIDARLAGPGASCNLEGVYHAIGTEHVAHRTTIVHADSHGSSHEEYRGLVDDAAHAVFDGIIEVHKDTKGTAAHQQNHNLLLSERATVNTKPHLEIDSDDLTASHGATVGALDPKQLFFLRARGIGEAQARAILTYSFVRTILDRISSEPVRALLAKRLLARLPHAADMEELAQ